MFLSEYLKKTFGCKVYKISLSTGCTCPNRDGKCGFGGCSFCSEGGSGDFAESGDIKDQILNAKKRVELKFPKGAEKKYIAYFQSFSNTYINGNITFDYLKNLFIETIYMEEIVALSIGTRPDCIDNAMLDFLGELNKIKPVWVELGLQTIHDQTAENFNRGYSLQTFEDMYYKLKQKNLSVIVHTILGLPDETESMMEETVKYLANLSPAPDGIKLQNLQILKGTGMHLMFEQNPFHVFSLEEYGNLLKKIIPLIPEETVIHRITGDGPKSLLVEPKWSRNKKMVMNYLRKVLEVQ